MDPDDLMSAGDYFPMDECGLKRRDHTDDNPRIDYPFVGQGIWLTPYPTNSDLMEAVLAFSSGRPDQMGTALPRLREGIADSVRAHNLRNPRTDEELPSFWENPDAVKLPPEALVYIANTILQGELPSARPKGSLNGRVGTTTPPSSAPRTSNSPAVRRRPRNG